MNASIPAYYRQFVEDISKSERVAKPTNPVEEPPVEEVEEVPLEPEEPVLTYRAHTFSMDVGEDWKDHTVFSLVGPVTDGIQHNITVTVDPEIEAKTLLDYADWHVRVLQRELKGCRVLKQDPVDLTNGIPAYRVLYVWHPAPQMRLYQEQLYVLHEGIGYKLTATFTKKTRKTLGGEIERMMLSFNPSSPSPEE